MLSLAVIQENLVIAVNQSYIEKDSEISFEGGEEVAVIPPISGGWNERRQVSLLLKINYEIITEVI